MGRLGRSHDHIDCPRLQIVGGYIRILDTYRRVKRSKCSILSGPGDSHWDYLGGPILDHC